MAFGFLVLKAPEIIHFMKLSSHVSLRRALTLLLKTVHRSCCIKFHGGATELLINKKLVLVASQDDGILPD